LAAAVIGLTKSVDFLVGLLSILLVHGRMFGP
jgi:hypothetical protein